MAVADVFDALTSQRPYKEAYTNDVAFTMIGQLAGTHLDADCVRALVDSATRSSGSRRSSARTRSADRPPPARPRARPR